MLKLEHTEAIGQVRQIKQYQDRNFQDTDMVVHQQTSDITLG